MVLNKQEKDRLPGTLKRSPVKAQATYMHTLERLSKNTAMVRLLTGSRSGP